MTDTFDAKRTRKPGNEKLEVIEEDSDTHEYTFVPRDASETERLTAWITVDADTVVDLGTHR